MTRVPHPLDGVRVLDLSRLLPGPLCGQHLADLGAEVIKIEDPGPGDYARPSVRELVNRGKKGLTLNLKSEAGREAFLRLVETADVVLESFRPGVMARLGVDYAVLQARRPALVYCAISGYGQAGSRSLEPGHDINFLAVAGVLDRTGRADSPPVIPGFLLADIVGGTLTAAMGILAALLGARASGHGRFIDVSMADSLVAHSVLPLADLLDGERSGRGGGRHNGGTARYQVYTTRDGRHLAVGAEETKFWNPFCEAIGAPELADGVRPLSMTEHEVTERIRSVLASLDSKDWHSRLRHLQACVSPVLTFDEALSDPDIARRTVIDDPVSGQPTAFRLPFVMSGCMPFDDRRSPRQGEHSEEILRTLGYSGKQIAALALEKVI